jgi:hypothetical protein
LAKFSAEGGPNIAESDCCSNVFAIAAIFGTTGNSGNRF